MNIIKGFFNPLEMYLHISNMDNNTTAKRGIFLAVAVLISLSIIPLFISNVDVKTYIVGVMVANAEILGFLMLPPLCASFIARQFAKRESSKQLGEKSAATTFSKTFLILVTSQIYVYIVAIIMVFEFSMLLSFTYLHLPKWIALTVIALSVLLIVIQTILAIIWYVYKPFSAILICSRRSISKRLVVLIFAYLAAIVPCQILEYVVDYSAGTSVIATNGLLNTTNQSYPVQQNQVVTKTETTLETPVLTGMTIDTTHVD